MKKLTLLIIVSSILVGSCAKMITRVMINNYNGTFMVWHYTNGKKHVQFIPMSHINKAEKFERIKYIVDSLREDGYIIYYENVTLKNPHNILHNDTILRKFRNIIGIVPGDYSDSKNDSYKDFALKGYIMQSAKNTGIDKTRDIQADLSIDSLVTLYEKERGEIMLEVCDWSTPFSNKYTCHKLDIKNQKFMALRLRNRYLSYFLTHSKDMKIVVMYGAEHEKTLEDDLKKQDPNWQLIHNNPSIRW